VDVAELEIIHHLSLQERTGPPGSLAFARWAGWSAGEVGRRVKWSTSIDFGPTPLILEGQRERKRERGGEGATEKVTKRN